MNAIVALCHFCEQHGPNVVFCTQTVRGNLAEMVDHPPPAADPRKNCEACFSIGPQLGYLSTDNSLQFLSTQSPVISATAVSLIKQAAFRSLSCDIYTKRDGGFVFFGDAARGHTLSHAFDVQDATARGFKKLFSIIILMKDKAFLLNTQPFLSDYLQKISADLQESASKIFKMEEAKQSERVRRLTQESVMIPPSRSLATLTGEKNVFAHLHSHFCWLLWGGSRYLLEQVTIGSPVAPPWLGNDTEEGFTLIQIDKEDWLMRKRFGTSQEQHDSRTIETLRRFFNNHRTDFIRAVYCCLTGIQLVFRGPAELVQRLAKGFSKFLPESFERLLSCTVGKYEADKRVICLTPETAIPQLGAKVCQVDVLINETVLVKWNGDVGTKLPDLLQKIIKAFEEKHFNDDILEKHLRVLVHEWKNKMMCIKQIQNNQDMNKMKKVLGIQPQDSQVVNYWFSVD